MTEPKKKQGRPSAVVDWDVVDKLCTLQCIETEVAAFLGVSVDVIYRACLKEHGKTFEEYFKEKRGTGRIALRRAQWQAAQKGNPTMLIWLGKQYLEQEDKSYNKHAGADGGAIEFSPGKMSEQQIDEQIKMLSEKLKLIEQK